MVENKNTRIIEIDGQKLKVTSVFDENADKDIINLVYDKFKDKDHFYFLGEKKYNIIFF